MAPNFFSTRAQQGKLLQVVAGDEGQVVELVIGGEGRRPSSDALRR